MSGQICYHERCICGAEITMSNNFELVDWEHLTEQFEKWQSEHNQCIPLFTEVQRSRLAQLKINTRRWRSLPAEAEK